LLATLPATDLAKKAAATASIAKDYDELTKEDAAEPESPESASTLQKQALHEALSMAAGDLVAVFMPLPPLERRLLARFLRHFSRVASSSANPLTNADLGKNFSSALFGSTGDTSKALADLIICYPHIREAFKLQAKDRGAFGQRACKPSIEFVATPELSSDATAESAQWFNNVGRRWFMEYGAALSTLTGIKADLQKVFDDIPDRPDFMEGIVVNSVSLGDSLPVLRDLVRLDTRMDEEFCISAAMTYTNGIKIFLTINLDIMGMTCPIAVSVQCASFEGRLRMFLPAPHVDNGGGYITFEHLPSFDVAVEILNPSGSEGGAKNLFGLNQLPAIKQFILKKIKEALSKMMVLPTWERIVMPWYQKAKEVESAMLHLVGHSPLVLLRLMDI
jgi:hypothetical protein